MCKKLTLPIAVVIDSWDYPYNGTVVSTRRFIAALEAHFQFRIFCTPDPEIESVQFGVSCKKIAFSRLSLPGFNRIIESMKSPLARPDRKRLRKTLRQCGLLHVQYPFFLGLAAIREAKGLGIPVICSFHIQPENLLMNLGIQSRWLVNLLYWFFIKFYYNHADLVISPSEFAAGLLRAHGLQTPTKVISNGVPEQFLKVERKQSGVNFKVLSVGRLAGEKKQDLILKAIAASKFKGKIEVTLVGAGPQESALKALAATLGLNYSIGSVDDASLLKLYSEADLFVHAGEIELEGMSVIEAMATGNAIIVSNSRDSATPSLIQDKGALFENRSLKDLTQKIDYYLSEPNIRARQGEENRKWAAQFSHEVSIEKLSELYRDLLVSSKR